MFEFITSQHIELAKLDEALAAMRVRYIRSALEGKGVATNSVESDQETEEILTKIKDFYRGEQWKSYFLADPEEPDPDVKKVLYSSRDMSLNSVVMLHKLIMNLPVVGCEPDSADVEG